MSSTIMRPGSEFRFDNFSIAQFDPKLNQKTNLLVHTDNAITITGSLASPLFAGKIGLNSLDSDVPQLPQGGAPISSLLMNPRFDLDIETTSMAQVRAGLVVLNGRGQTHIAGDATAGELQRARKRPRRRGGRPRRPLHGGPRESRARSLGRTQRLQAGAPAAAAGPAPEDPRADPTGPLSEPIALSKA